MTLQEVIKLIKSNNATALSVNQTLHPDVALKLIDLVVEQSDFLKKIRLEKCRKLKTPLPIINMSGKSLTRVAEGTEATEDNATFAKSSNEGKTLDLANVDLFYDLLFSVIDNNHDEKTLIPMIEKQIAKVFANDLLDLGTNGVSDTYNRTYNATTNPVPMYTLAKGWSKLLKESTRTNKVNSTGDANLLVTMEKTLNAHPNDYKTPQCKYIMSPSNLEKYNVLMGANDSSAGIYLQGNAKTYLGYGIEVNPYMTDDELWFGDPEDLVMAIGTDDTQKSMESKPRKKCIEYTYTLPVDYAIARDRALTIAHKFT
jgi:hypothetical protein